MSPLFVFRVVLDDEPLPAWAVPGLELDRYPRDGDEAGGEVEVSDTQLGELAPAQAGLDICLHEQPHGVVSEGVLDAFVLLDGDDPAGLLGHWGSPHTFARVKEGDLVVQRRSEDGVEDNLALADGGRAGIVVAFVGGSSAGKGAGRPFLTPQVSIHGRVLRPAVLPGTYFHPARLHHQDRLSADCPQPLPHERGRSRMIPGSKSSP